MCVENNEHQVQPVCTSMSNMLYDMVSYWIMSSVYFIKLGNVTEDIGSAYLKPAIVIVKFSSAYKCKVLLLLNIFCDTPPVDIWRLNRESDYKHVFGWEQSRSRPDLDHSCHVTSITFKCSIK